MGIFIEFCLQWLVEILIVVLARKWAVLLTNCKWAIVNSIRIQKWVVHSYKTQMGYEKAEHTNFE